ncbi:OmpA family protein [Rhodobacteraceae bacterium]|nr:OmpA family protein [Paracoccaceae bacterium]
MLKGITMKRLLNSTAVASLVLFHAQAWPVMAQDTEDAGAVAAQIQCDRDAQAGTQDECDPAAKADAASEGSPDGEAGPATEITQGAETTPDVSTGAQADVGVQADTTQADTTQEEPADPEKAADPENAADQEKATDTRAQDQLIQQDTPPAAKVQPVPEPDADSAAGPAGEDATDAGPPAGEEAPSDMPAEDPAADVISDRAPQAEGDAASDMSSEADPATPEATTQPPAAQTPEAQTSEDDTQTSTDGSSEPADMPADRTNGDADPDATAEPAPPANSVEGAQTDATDAQPATDAANGDTTRAEAEAELDRSEDGMIVDPNAGLKTAQDAPDPDAQPVEAPVVDEDTMQALSNLISGQQTETDGETAQEAQAAAAGQGEEGAQDADTPSGQAVNESTEVITEGTTRTATEEFSAAPKTVAPGKKDRLSNLEKAGLLGLGALAVGAILKQNNTTADTAAPNQQQVVSNTGDRVVVMQPDGSYQVYKDDDALLRQPGSTLRTETYNDGSTRTVVDRNDGSQIVTIRNATGRVLRRTHVDVDGQERVLFNDLAQETAVNVSNLPAPKSRPVVISANEGDAAIKAALARREIEKLDRSFSLRQVRDLAQVRHLAAMIGVERVTFASGSSALTTSQVDALAGVGEVMQNLLAENPNEVFLIEGHTDATGKAAMNLALSDRRAETVALALTEYFDIPPENMVVQGYGETELLVQTQAAETRNRRVGVRIITPLL